MYVHIAIISVCVCVSRMCMQFIFLYALGKARAKFICDRPRETMHNVLKKIDLRPPLPTITFELLLQQV